jgi:hypothetical protein
MDRPSRASAFNPCNCCLFMLLECLNVLGLDGLGPKVLQETSVILQPHFPPPHSPCTPQPDTLEHFVVAGLVTMLGRAPGLFRRRSQHPTPNKQVTSAVYDQGQDSSSCAVLGERLLGLLKMFQVVFATLHRAAFIAFSQLARSQLIYKLSSPMPSSHILLQCPYTLRSLGPWCLCSCV